jgi:serine/threonine-protein kinase
MKSIGKYQVIEELGGSPTGKTYRVRDAFRNREFAAKVLETVPGMSAEAKEQFCEHLAACAELTHRHIAKVHDLGEIEEGIFVATEWRPGMDVRQFVQENQDLPLDQKLAVIAQVAEGLAFAHSRGIAHGNLKPSNIFIDAARDVSILDFGIAKWLAALLNAGSRPQGLVVNYLAPEQVLGQPFDARSDIFALGLMLYELACGKYPFSAEPGLIPREIVHGEPPPLRSQMPSQMDAQVPEELEQLVANALKKDPSERMQTAEEFASGLYLAAQQVRRMAAAAAPVAPAEPVSNEPIVEQLPPALTPQPVILPPAPVAATEMPAWEDTIVLQPAPREIPAVPEPAPVAAPKVRERPQDAEPVAQPWSARSYAAGSPLPPVANANLPKPAAALQPGPSQPTVHYPPAPQGPPAPPAFQPPQSFLRPAVTPFPPPPPKSGKMAKRVLIAALGMFLAAGIVGSLISRQNLHASQNKSHAQAPAPEPAPPVATPSNPPPPVVPEAHAPKRPEPPAPEDVVNPEVSAKQILNGPVRTLWESGRYAQALAMVDKILTDEPANEDAHSWKKKIREAQAAEAALK